MGRGIEVLLVWGELGTVNGKRRHTFLFLGLLVGHKVVNKTRQQAGITIGNKHTRLDCVQTGLDIP